MTSQFRHTYAKFVKDAPFPLELYGKTVCSVLGGSPSCTLLRPCLHGTSGALPVRIRGDPFRGLRPDGTTVR